MNHLIDKLDYIDFYQFILERETYLNPKLSDRVDISEFCSGLHKKGVIFYERNNKQLTGILACYCNDMIGKRAFISLILVDKKYQNKGLGTTLFNQFFKYALQNGMKTAALETSSLSHAYKLYNKLGFNILFEKDNRLYMEKELK